MLEMTNNKLNAKRVRKNYSVAGLCAFLLAATSGSAALADEADDACAAPALAFIAGSSLHVSHALDVTELGTDRITLDPYAEPPEDAFVPFEGHPRWGRVAMAVIVNTSDEDSEYLTVRRETNELPSLPVPGLRDYFVIYLEKAAPADSEFADYLFHSTQGLAAGYHLVHAEEETTSCSSEPSYHYTVVDIDQPIPNNFERGVTPTGINL